MRRPIKWVVAALVLLLVVGGAMRLIAARKERAAAEPVAKAQAVAELAATDVLKTRSVELSRGLPVSGSLRAVNSALVKARVAGELQGLTLREGDAVRAGQVIARIDATEYQARLRQASQQAAAAKAQIDIAQRQWDNNKALVDQGFISKTALDTSLNNLNAARSTWQAAVAASDLAKKAVDDTVLRAPIAGVVSQRLAQPGERAGIDARVVEIVDLSRLELEASLSAADSVQVRVGQSAELHIEGMAKPVAARVVRINPSAQAGSRSVLAYLALADATGLRQGLFAQGRLATGSARALAVPLAAVRTDKPAPYVQVVENDAVAHRQVTPGARGDVDGESWVAVDGVAEGAVVIKGAVGQLREGTPVRFTGAAGKPASGTSARIGHSREGVRIGHSGGGVRFGHSREGVRIGHSREGGNPGLALLASAEGALRWVPAFAGMTGNLGPGNPGHSREGGNPGLVLLASAGGALRWVPAFAGMTGNPGHSREGGNPGLAPSAAPQARCAGSPACAEDDGSTRCAGSSACAEDDGSLMLQG